MINDDYENDVQKPYALSNGESHVRLFFICRYSPGFRSAGLRDTPETAGPRQIWHANLPLTMG